MIDVNKEYRDHFRQFANAGDLWSHPDRDKHGYNWRAACEHNDFHGLFEQTDEVVYEWNDGTDEPRYAFIVRLKTGEFLVAEGWHDYTGWDCQSGLEVCGVTKTIAEATQLVSSDKHGVALSEWKRGLP